MSTCVTVCVCVRDRQRGWSCKRQTGSKEARSIAPTVLSVTQRTSAAKAKGSKQWRRRQPRAASVNRSHPRWPRHASSPHLISLPPLARPGQALPGGAKLLQLAFFAACKSLPQNRAYNLRYHTQIHARIGYVNLMNILINYKSTGRHAWCKVVYPDFSLRGSVSYCQGRSNILWER